MTSYQEYYERQHRFLRGWRADLGWSRAGYLEAMTVGSFLNLCVVRIMGLVEYSYSTPEVFVRYGYILVEDSWWRTGLVSGNSCWIDWWL